MINAVAAARPAAAIRKPIRVMVVDDAIVVRRQLTRWIGDEKDMMVTACLRTGREAVEQVEACNPDVVVLDVDMPELDGISALPQLLQKKRDLVVIMASTLTRRSAEISLRALSLGAADYVPKPETALDADASAAFRRELLDKIRNLGRRGGSLLRQRRPATAPREIVPPSRRASMPSAETVAFTLRPFALLPPRALLIGSSTGGPQALTALIGQLGGAIDRAPVLVTQHMPQTFTTVLAEHLTRISGRRVREAAHEEPIVPGGIYVAPGGRHMRVVRGAGGPMIALGDDPPINFCKPSIDPLLSSAAQVWGAGSLALILTGMGSDGTNGAAEIAAAGGSVIAQDEETSVVWGMPRAVALAGLCSAVLPLGQIPAEVNRLFVGGRA
ncbi:MAG: chemotaxis response regulator protein-glutamate methylesterase [Xanthobacteraceae bacterium]